MNFEVVSRLVVPGQPERSRLLRKALAVQAGGAPFHVGGKFFESQADPEWQIMAEWVRAAETSPELTAAEATPPLLDFEFFRTCVQQVFLNKREGRMECVHCHGGGSRGFARTLSEGRAFWNLEKSPAETSRCSGDTWSPAIHCEVGFSPTLSRRRQAAITSTAAGDAGSHRVTPSGRCSLLGCEANKPPV